ncbi:hypothetical protein D3C73_966350 [compost metagenome]
MLFKAVVLGLELLLDGSKLLLPGLDLRLTHGVFFVAVILHRLGGFIAFTFSHFRAGRLNLAVQLGLLGFQLGDGVDEVAHQEPDQLVLQRAFLARLIFQRGDYAGAPGIGHAFGAACL